ncbi:MAG: hypothetical protein LBI03_02360 [Clostridiales bacterium]|jgi:hypothetical protein|nr:hypothetical protein [Clostridiales bacterium]
MSEEMKRKNAKPASRYRPPPTESPPDYVVGIECPLCGGRACDLSDIPQEPFWIGLKCPQCNRIVDLQCCKTKLYNTS